MNMVRLFTISAMLTAPLAYVGCDSDGSNATGGTGGAGGTETVSSAATTSGAGGGAAANAFVRIAHLSTDAPAADFCVKTAAQTVFTGPLLMTVQKNAAGVA